MKTKKVFLILFVAALYHSPLKAQVHFSGALQSSFYSWEALDQDKRLDYYQGLQLQVTPEKYSNLSFRTYLRLAYRGNPSDWDDRVYNLNVNWKSTNNRYQFRLGRQFLYSGVINGTIDGLLFSARPTKKMNLKLLGGIEAPYKRKLDLRNDANAFGGFLSYRFAPEAKVDLSYYQNSRNDNIVWQLAGATVNGKVMNRLYYQAQLDYNLKSSTYQTMRYRLNYYYQKWSFSAEYNSQKPRIYEDSFFTIFEIEAYNQMRGGVTYRFKEYQIGLQYLYTKYESDNNNQMLVTFGNNWGIVGLVYQNGFGGDNVGLYGEIRYPMMRNLSVRLFSNYYNYERQTTQISEDATSFSGGFTYHLTKQLQVRAELQETMNNVFKNDLRGLVRVNYSFKY